MRPYVSNISSKSRVRVFLLSLPTKIFPSPDLRDILKRPRMLFQQRQLLSYVSGDEWSTKMFGSENNLKLVLKMYSKKYSCVRVNGVIANYRDTQLCVEMALSVIIWEITTTRKGTKRQKS